MSRGLHGRQVGSLVGATGGLVFVLVNAGGLPGGTLLRVLAVSAAVVVLALTLLRPPPAPPEPSSRAWRTYRLCVVAMVLAVPAGAAALGAGGLEELVLPWVVLVVGLHFLPFAPAFGTPLFRALGLALALVATAGAVATRLGADPAWTGVVAGGVLLVAAAAPLVRGLRPATTA